MKAQLVAEDSPEFAPGSGMLGLRQAMALAVARRAREMGLIEHGMMGEGNALPRVFASPAEAMADLRKNILEEQARRAELFEKTPIEVLANEPAVTDDEPDDEFNGERGSARL
jgi:hypothetical protein